MFEPIPQTPRYRLVADALIGRIADGSLPSGKKLPPDRVLVDQLGVSRATLREALIALEVMGYVEHRFGSGVFVAPKPDTKPRGQVERPVDIAPLSHGPFEVLEARRLIEGELAALAADQITPAQLDTLWDAISHMQTSEDWAAKADERFHRVLADAAGNAVLAMLAVQFWQDRANDPLWSAIETAVQDSNRRPALVAEHEAIVEALTEGDAQAARSAMHRHLDSFAAALLAQWDAPDEESTEATPHARLSSAVAMKP